MYFVFNLYLFFDKVPKNLYDSDCDKVEDLCISNTQCLAENKTFVFRCGCLEGSWWNKTHCSIK